MTKTKRKRNPCRTIFFLILAVLILSTFRPQGAYPLPVEEERALGKKFLKEVRNNFEIVDDDFADRYINGLGQYLVRHLETKHFPFHFYIINDRNLNAFAGPGGHVFIFTGLIEIMDSVDELAAVISHEIAHVSARHISNRLEEAKKIGLATAVGILAGIILGGEGGGALMSGSMAAGIQAQLAYSREDERQADQLGLRYMRKAGFDPGGMIPTLNKIQKKRMLDPEAVPPYLLTHPLGPERIANIEIMLKSGPEIKDRPAEATLFRRYFPHLKAILRAKYSDPKDAEAEFKRLLERDPNSALAHMGLGLVYKRRNEFPLALKHLEAASKGEPESKTISIYLGEVYQLLGQDEKAVPHFLDALEKDRTDGRALFLLARSYQNLGQHNRAIPLFERLSSMEPVEPEVYYGLGISYGRQNRLARAHYYFGIYFMKKRNKEKALYHLNRARDLARGEPTLRERISRALKDLSG